MTQSKLAAQMLHHVQSPQAAAALMRMADVADAINIPAGLPDDAARAELKNSVYRAATAARSTASPELLHKFAKDRRVNVVRALAENPNLPDDILCSLADYAAVNSDQQVARSLVGKLPAGVLYEHLSAPGSALLGTYQMPASELATDAINRGTREDLVVLLGAAGYEHMTISVLCSCYEDESRITFMEACSAVRPEYRAQVLHNTTLITELCDIRIADALIAVGPEEAFKSSHLSYRFRELRDDSHQITVDAFRKLIPAITRKAPAAVAYFASYILPDELIEETVKMLVSTPKAAHGYAAFVMRNGAKLNEHQVTRLVAAFRNANTENAVSSELAEAMFSTVTVPIDTVSTVTLARSDLSKVFCSWMTGTYKLHMPRPGEPSQVVPAFMADKGYGLRQSVIRTFSMFLDRDYDTAVVDEMMDACGDLFNRNIGSEWSPKSDTVLAYVVGRFDREFADHGEAWCMAAGMIADWPSSIGDLTEACKLALGISTRPVELLTDDTDDGQMTLFQL